MRELTIGDDFVRTSNLTNADTGVAWDVSGATSIIATVVSSDRATQYCAETTLSDGDTGSDWAGGVVIVNIPADTTGTISGYITGRERGMIELQVDKDGRKTTVRDAVYITTGHIE